MLSIRLRKVGLEGGYCGGGKLGHFNVVKGDGSNKRYEQHYFIRRMMGQTDCYVNDTFVYRFKNHVVFFAERY